MNKSQIIFALSASKTQSILQKLRRYFLEWKQTPCLYNFTEA